jgi:hypothetical protein
MVARGKGSIINVSSMAGQIGLAGGAAYGATKGALSSEPSAYLPIVPKDVLTPSLSIFVRLEALPLLPYSQYHSHYNRVRDH